jgi:hypothetical protein
MSDFIKAETLATKICGALDIDPGRVRCVTVRLAAGEPAYVGVEMLGTARLLEIDYHGLSGIEIKTDNIDLAKEGWLAELESAKERVKFIEDQLLLINHVQKKRSK